MLSTVVLVIVFAILKVASANECDNYECCKDYRICDQVRCASPPEICPKNEPFLVWSGPCGCCGFCSKEPKKGPCGLCDVDVKCKEKYPICTRENQTVTLDDCGCCKVCRDILQEGEYCQKEGCSIGVCAIDLKCIDGKCQKIE